MIRLLALAALLAPLSALGAWLVGDARVQDVYLGDTRVCDIYLGASNAPVYELAGTRPTIANFGASDGGGAGNRRTLTINATALPLTPTVSAALAGNTGYELRRNAGGAVAVVASSPSAAASLHYAEALSGSFHPPASGWEYILSVSNSAISPCGNKEAHATIRVVTAPTLTSFTATAPGLLQGPGTLLQCVFLSWVATAGDPAATWALSQTGFHVPTLPSSQHLTPAAGLATGLHRQRVCVSGTPGQTTTLTLAGTNEAGSASANVPVSWAGGQ